MVNRSQAPERCPSSQAQNEASMLPAVAGLPSYRRALPRRADSASVARHAAAAVLTAWSLAGLVDDVQLVVSELVANAVDHAVGVSIEMSMTRTAERRIRVAVTDMDRRRLSRQNADPDDERGRGLLLVDGLSERWGVCPLPSGKQVWAELVAP